MASRKMRHQLVFLSALLFVICFINARPSEKTLSIKKADIEIVVPMTVDVDGAPTAYGPDNSRALDYEIHAHEGARTSGAIVGYRTDKNNQPIIQKAGDPAPGFYISETAYTDINNPNKNDPRRYVNAAEINYTVLAASAKLKGVAQGDFCVVHSVKKTKRYLQ